jgi:predicted nucleotidyltransferase
MDNTKIDTLKLKIIEIISKIPFEKLSVDKIRKLLIQEGVNANYATTYRKVDSLKNQNILIKSMYGMSSEITLNLQSDNTLSLLSLIENSKSEEFFQNLKGNIKISLQEIKNDMAEIIEIRSVLIFGSYAKGKQKPDSDLDILILFEPSKLIKNKNYEEDIKSGIISILRTVELRSSLKINPIIVSIDENCEMILNQESNVGKEALLNHLILKGNTEYWRSIAKCYQKQS